MKALWLASTLAVATCQAQTVAEAPAVPLSSDTPAIVAAPALPKGPNWTLVHPKNLTSIEFHGVQNMDNAGSDGHAMVYPAFGALGFLAAIATHGLIVEGQKSAEKTRIQKQSDIVLEPFGDVLKNFQLQELMQKGVDQTVVGARKRWVQELPSDEQGWVIDSLPMFSMTQDRETLILDNVIMVRQPGASVESAYKNTVRVVSEAKQSEDHKAFWNADNGARLKEESIRLFAQSLDLGLLDAQRTSGAIDNPTRKTVRYMEGRTEKMERGEVLEERCGRTVIKTLRGWVMSVPSKQGAAASPCS